MTKKSVKITFQSLKNSQKVKNDPKRSMIDISHVRKRKNLLTLPKKTSRQQKTELSKKITTGFSPSLTMMLERKSL